MSGGLRRLVLGCWFGVQRWVSSVTSISILVNRKLKKKETRICFGFPISSEDFPTLLQIDKLIFENRQEKIKFGRSKKRKSSFFPKLHILIIRDMNRKVFGELVKTWRKKKNIFKGRSFEFTIDSLQHTQDGLLFIHIKCPKWLAKARTEIARCVQGFRTGAETQGKYGDKHWYKPLHISAAFQISKQDFKKIDKKFTEEGYIGKELTFDPPVMYERASGWDDEVEVVYY